MLCNERMKDKCRERERDKDRHKRASWEENTWWNQKWWALYSNAIALYCVSFILSVLIFYVNVFLVVQQPKPFLYIPVFHFIFSYSTFSSYAMSILLEREEKKENKKGKQRKWKERERVCVCSRIQVKSQHLSVVLEVKVSQSMWWHRNTHTYFHSCMLSYTHIWQSIRNKSVSNATHANNNQE